MFCCVRMREPGASLAACPLSRMSGGATMTNEPRNAFCGNVRWNCWAAAGAAMKVAATAARTQRYMVLIQWLLARRLGAGEILVALQGLEPRTCGLCLRSRGEPGTRAGAHYARFGCLIFSVGTCP